MLASGSGTNLQALIEADDSDVDIVGVITDRSGAPALERAAAASIPTRVIPYADFENRTDFSEAVADEVEALGAEAMILAGFMRILSPEAVRRFRHRIINIHPSLLPSFKGAHAVAQALAHGVKVTGVTVHFVDEEVDHGPIIAQRPVEVRPGDDEESLHGRIRTEEHKLYPEVVSAFARGEISVTGREVTWR